MAKSKSIIYYCKECGFESAKWLGQCPGCKEWNSFVEAPTVKTRSGKDVIKTIEDRTPVTLGEIDTTNEERMATGFSELDRVLGGGIVPGALMLVGGDPGIGKSTLLLQVCRNISSAGKRVLYISGEESLKQIKIRANRIGEFTDNLKLLCETNLDVIENVIKNDPPQLVIIDSIQTMFREDVDSAPGSVGQVRESTNALMHLAKGLAVPIFIVGHVTKEGVVAGPRMLEHMVDTVIYFEGDRHATYRIVRGVKNRFGSTNEIGVFEMRQEGLRQVLNPSEYLLEGRPEGASGSVVACLIEGTRPILVETQALISRTNFGMPRRTSAGIDYNRVNLLMAVIEKRLGVSLGDCDAYVNIVGGMKVQEPALDLAVVLAILSSYNNKPIAADTIVFGEVGLSGEIRSVSMTAQRVSEAKKLGFKKCIMPKVSMDALDDVSGITVVGVENLNELLNLKL
ncbi:MAG: DNA repair protein RadA [Lachnospiraceae bacterium]|nr:DNA repair protein RadA [Lachnospiraceae bacterium]